MFCIEPVTIFRIVASTLRECLNLNNSTNVTSERLNVVKIAARNRKSEFSRSSFDQGGKFSHTDWQQVDPCHVEHLYNKVTIMVWNKVLLTCILFVPPSAHICFGNWKFFKHHGIEGKMQSQPTMVKSPGIVLKILSSNGELSMGQPATLPLWELSHQVRLWPRMYCVNSRLVRDAYSSIAMASEKTFPKPLPPESLSVESRKLDCPELSDVANGNIQGDPSGFSLGLVGL